MTISTFDVHFEFERETKRTYRFRELAAEGKQLVGVLYVKKDLFEQTPKGLTIEVKGIEFS